MELSAKALLITLEGIPRQVVPWLVPPKTDASRWTVPLPTLVVEAQARHLEQYPAGIDGLVFTNDRGEAIRRNHWSDVWRPATEAAKTTMHDLRTSLRFASHPSRQVG